MCINLGQFLLACFLYFELSFCQEFVDFGATLLDEKCSLGLNTLELEPAKKAWVKLQKYELD
jgi:hypothetical protein